MSKDWVLEQASWMLSDSTDAAIVTDLRGRIEYVNPAFERMTGYDSTQALGRTPAILKSGRQDEAFYRTLWNTIRQGHAYHGVLVNRRRDGTLFHEEKTIYRLCDAEGRPSHYLSCGRDLSTAGQWHAGRMHEAVSGIAQHELFLDRLQQAILHAERTGEHLAVVLLRPKQWADLDGREQPDIADERLRATAFRLRGCVRQADTVATLERGVFALLLRDTQDIGRVMNAVMAAGDKALGRGDTQGRVAGRIDDRTADRTAALCAGVSCYPADGLTPAALLDRASEALTRAMSAEASPDGAGRWTQAGQTPPPLARLHQGADASTGLGLDDPATLEALLGQTAVSKRVLRAGEHLYRAGERCRHLHLLRVGVCKLYSLSADGRREVVAMRLRSDWLGLDGLVDGLYRYDAVASDVCEVLSVRYDALLRVSRSHPAVLSLLHAAMARQSLRDRETQRGLNALPADARVAGFLHRWAEELSACGLRNDQIVLPATRAEIGEQIGLRLESVSRAMNRLAREDLIRIGAHNRRAIRIPNLDALRNYVNQHLSDGHV